MKSSALPPGVSYKTGSEPDIGAFQFEAGDFAVMLSDGITANRPESWIEEIIASYQGTSPKELAHQILEGVLSTGQADDDMTVLTIHFRERN